MSKKHRLSKDKSVSTSVDLSPKVHQRDKVDFNLDINIKCILTENQKKLIELIEDKHTRVVFLKGPAGTSKTYTSLIAGLNLLNKKSVSDIIYVRSVVESASKSLGFLPGEADDKMQPFLMPLMDKLDELLPKAQSSKLIKEERIQGIPVNYLRGASFNAKFVVIDEAQNFLASEIVTALTRIGKFSKFIILGDPLQSDIGKKSGFIDMFDLFNDDASKEQGIHCFSFTKDDIVRSGILKYIVERIESCPKIQNHSNHS